MFWHGTKRSCLERNILACSIPPTGVCPKVGHLLCAAVRAKKKMGLVQFIRRTEQPPSEPAEDADTEARVYVPDEVEAR